MRSLLKCKYFKLYLLTAIIISFSTYSIYINLTRISSDASPLATTNPIKACGSSLVPALVSPYEIYKTALKVNPLSLKVGSIQLTASNHYLTAKTKDKEATVSVSQPDFGVVEFIKPTQSGEIFAMGEQLSYRMKLSLSQDKPVFSKLTELPILFPKGCKFLGRISRNCKQFTGSYSNELKTVFLTGYNYWGKFTSLVLGLKSGDQNISNSITPFFAGDIPNTGNVLLRGSKGFALYDGKVITACTPK